jgi:hypothetical protein
MEQKSIARTSGALRADTYSIEFSNENTQAIRDMMPNFGDTEDDVILNALTVLYAIHETLPDVRGLTLHGASGKTVRISMPK